MGERKRRACTICGVTGDAANQSARPTGDVTGCSAHGDAKIGGPSWCFGVSYIIQTKKIKMSDACSVRKHGTSSSLLEACYAGPARSEGALGYRESRFASR